MSLILEKSQNIQINVKNLQCKAIRKILTKTHFEWHISHNYSKAP
jgi:hypothetical protein